MKIIKIGNENVKKCVAKKNMKTTNENGKIKIANSTRLQLRQFTAYNVRVIDTLPRPFAHVGPRPLPPPAAAFTLIYSSVRELFAFIFLFFISNILFLVFPFPTLFLLRSISLSPASLLMHFIYLSFDILSSLF